MSLREAKIVRRSAQQQPLDLKQRAEDIAEGIDSATEIVESPTGGRLEFLGTIEHPSLYPLLGLLRRQVGQGQEVLTLIMGAFCRKLLAALLVDQRCDRIGESARPWVLRCPRANGVALDHPPRTEFQDRIEAGAEGRHFPVGRGSHIRPTEGPRSHQCAVLKQHHSVIDQGIVQQQVRKTLSARAMFSELHGHLQAFGVAAVSPRKRPFAG